MKHVKINVSENGTGKVVVVAEDGTETDITDVVSTVEVTGWPFDVSAQITLPWASGEFLATAAHVPVSTAMALQALGWTPPRGQPSLYDTAAPDKVTDSFKEPHAPATPAVFGEIGEDGTFQEFPTVPAPASTEPGCQHPDCVLDHPHAGPAELARREHP